MNEGGQQHRSLAVPPGKTIKDYMRRKEMDISDIAWFLSLSRDECRKLLKGEIPLTEHMASRLESILGVPAVFWMNLEKTYRERVDGDAAAEADEPQPVYIVPGAPQEDAEPQPVYLVPNAPANDAEPQPVYVIPPQGLTSPQ